MGGSVSPKCLSGTAPAKASLVLELIRNSGCLQCTAMVIFIPKCLPVSPGGCRDDRQQVIPLGASRLIWYPNCCLQEAGGNCGGRNKLGISSDGWDVTDAGPTLCGTAGFAVCCGSVVEGLSQAHEFGPQLGAFWEVMEPSGRVASRRD